MEQWAVELTATGISDKPGMFRKQEPSTGPGPVPERFDIARVAGVVLRAAVIVLESLGFPATSPALGVLEAAFLSPIALSCWAGCLILYVILALFGVSAPLDWFNALLAGRAVLLSLLLYKNRLLADNRVVRVVVRWCTRRTLPLLGFLLLVIPVALIRTMLVHPHQSPTILIVGLATLYVFRRWYRHYVGQGGTPIRRSIARIKLQDLLLLTGTVIVCVVALEIIMRVFFPQAHLKPTGAYRPHPTRIFDYAPSVPGRQPDEPFITNSLRLRDSEIAPKTPEMFRVICVGDSFTAGHMVSIADSFPKKLEQFLHNKHPGASISVVNFGVGAYGTIQELSKMRELGFALQPNVVILQLFPENDIRDNLRMAGKCMRSTQVEWQENLDQMLSQLTPSRRLRNFLRRHSHLLVFLHSRWRILKGSSVARAPSGRRKPKYPAIPGRPWPLETSLKEYYPELDEGWQLTANAIDELRDECVKRNIPLYALEIPAKYELTEEMRRVIIRAFGGVFDPDLYDFSKNSRYAHQLLEDLRVPYVDLRKGLLETEHPEDYYFVEDAHMNHLGNEFVASQLEPIVWKEYGHWLHSAGGSQTSGEAQK